jgi:hypothetical protein
MIHAVDVCVSIALQDFLTSFQTLVRGHTRRERLFFFQHFSMKITHRRPKEREMNNDDDLIDFIGFGGYKKLFRHRIKLVAVKGQASFSLF